MLRYRLACLLDRKRVAKQFLFGLCVFRMCNVADNHDAVVRIGEIPGSVSGNATLFVGRNKRRYAARRSRVLTAAQMWALAKNAMTERVYARRAKDMKRADPSTHGARDRVTKYSTIDARLFSVEVNWGTEGCDRAGDVTSRRRVRYLPGREARGVAPTKATATPPVHANRLASSNSSRGKRGCNEAGSP